MIIIILTLDKMYCDSRPLLSGLGPVGYIFYQLVIFFYKFDINGTLMFSYKYSSFSFFNSRLDNWFFNVANFEKVY